MNERMSAGETSVPLDELLAHREWVRRLALAITRDEHEADDVEQATWVAALRRPPTHRASLRGWLGTTVRRAASRLRRSERRRAHHEGSVPVRSDAEDAADLATRADAHRRVVEALVALEEPLRRTLLLRYFEGLPVGDVAARTGVPLETCRARLRRGRAKLRERLEREFGGSDALGAAVVLLAGREHGGGVAPAAGGMAMAGAGTKVVAAVAVAAAVGASLWWSGGDDSRAPESAAGPPVETPRQPAAERSPAPRAERPVVRPAPTEETAAPEVLPPASEPERTAKERLDAARMSVEWSGIGTLDALGEVSSRAEVGFFADRVLAEHLSKGENVIGSLRMEESSASMVLTVLGNLTGLEATVEERRVLIRTAGSGSPDEGSLVRLPTVARGADGRPASLTIRVVDDGGAPVEGALVFVAGANDPAGTAGADGTVVLRRRTTPVKYFARKAGRVDSFVHTVAVEAADAPPIELRLRGTAARLHGVVRTADGAAVEGAWLGWLADVDRIRPVDPGTGKQMELDLRLVRTSKDGKFDEPSVPPGRGTLDVGAPGYASATLPLDLVPGTESPLTVVLRREAGLSGNVTTTDGAPVAKAYVGLQRTQDGARRADFVATRRDGKYRFAGIPAGTYVARVFRPGAVMRGDAWNEMDRLAETTLDLAEGATVTWDPVVELPVK